MKSSGLVDLINSSGEPLFLEASCQNPHMNLIDYFMIKNKVCLPVEVYFFYKSSIELFTFESRNLGGFN